MYLATATLSSRATDLATCYTVKGIKLDGVGISEKMRFPPPALSGSLKFMYAAKKKVTFLFNSKCKNTSSKSGFLTVICRHFKTTVQVVSLLGKLSLIERKTDSSDSCCLHCSFTVKEKLYKFCNDHLFLDSNLCPNIHNAKTGCADAVQGMSTPQLCNCLQSLLKEIGTCITRTQLLQTWPRHSCLFLRFCWLLILPIWWAFKKGWEDSLKNSNVCITWAVKKCGLWWFVFPVI